jgi:hypothetical protein
MNLVVQYVERISNVTTEGNERDAGVIVSYKDHDADLPRRLVRVVVDKIAENSASL